MSSARVRAYVELARLSNLPTVLTNVLAGAALAEGGSGWRVAACCWAVAMLYAAGMMLNDVADVEHDRTARPERPLPSGRVAPAQARAVVVLLMVVALGILAVLGLPALGSGIALAVCIVAYDLLHHRHAWTMLLMGACRGLVYWVAAGATGERGDGAALAVVSVAVCLYTVLLTVIARSENERVLDRRRWLAMAIPMVGLAPILLLQFDHWRWTLVAAAGLVAWTGWGAAQVLRKPPRPKQAVCHWLSGFCLIDCLMLSAIGRWEWAVGAVVCWGLTVFGHRRIAGT